VVGEKGWRGRGSWVGGERGGSSEGGDVLKGQSEGRWGKREEGRGGREGVGERGRD
jgi:hypothetical protein